jgi:hypothetical protein
VAHPTTTAKAEAEAAENIHTSSAVIVPASTDATADWGNVVRTSVLGCIMGETFVKIYW